MNLYTTHSLAADTLLGLLLVGLMGLLLICWDGFVHLVKTRRK